MKKFLVSMVALMAMSTTCVYAVDEKWRLSAMLEQGDSIQLFYGANALQDAHNAAADSGAVITLSKGSWGDFTINKKIKLIGYYGFTSYYDSGTELYKLTIAANDVVVDGVCCDHMDVIKKDGLKVIHSYVGYLRGHYYPHVNTTIEQCYVQLIDSDFLEYSTNLRFYNSTLLSMPKYRGENIIYVTNCVVFFQHIDDLPYGAYHNNVMVGYYDTYHDVSYPNVYYYNTFTSSSNKEAVLFIDFGEHVVREGNQYMKFVTVFGEDWEDIDGPVRPVNPGTGSDGTPCGPLGGNGFTDKPQIPRVTGSDIDIYPDSTGKLNVKITVSAE